MNSLLGKMNFNSLKCNAIYKIIFVICMVAMVQMFGCYSFTGSSIPEHLKTLSIAPVGDNSGYGNPKYKDKLSSLLFEKFKNDNSFSIVDRNGNARLNVTIISINDETTVISQGELEKERKITVKCDVEYYDAVKKKQIFKKPFENHSVYEISNAQANRDNAVNIALDRISDDILIGVVSGGF